jgi:hypothetical protein
MDEDNRMNDPNKIAGYETGDVNVRKTIVLIIAGIIALVIILVLLNEYFSFTKEKEIYEMVLKPESKILIEIRAREDQILGSYGVADSAGGVYRIPIDSAMQIMLHEIEGVQGYKRK